MASEVLTSSHTEQHRPRPRVFIGSSTEQLRVSEELKRYLSKYIKCDVVLWTEAFKLSEAIMEAAQRWVEEVDFAVLVLGPDDLTVSRKRQYMSTRDNVMLELGLFLGGIGRKRTFFLYDRDVSRLKIPSDLAGVTAAVYSAKAEKSERDSLASVARKIADQINELGCRPRKPSCVGDWMTRVDWTPEYAARIMNFGGTREFIPTDPHSDGELHIYENHDGIVKGYSTWILRNGFDEYARLAVLLDEFEFSDDGTLERFYLRTAFRERLREFDYQPFSHFVIEIDEVESMRMRGRMRACSDVLAPAHAGRVLCRRV